MPMCFTNIGTGFVVISVFSSCFLNNEDGNYSYKLSNRSHCSHLQDRKGTAAQRNIIGEELCTAIGSTVLVYFGNIMLQCCI